MTIADAVLLGVRRVRLCCDLGGHESRLRLKYLKLPPKTPVRSVVVEKHFVCFGCGGRPVVPFPDWRSRDSECGDGYR